MLSTQATTNLNLDQRKKVAKQLSHSTTMEDSHYNLEVHTTKAAVEAYDIVRASAAANKPASKTLETAKPDKKPQVRKA